MAGLVTLLVRCRMRRDLEQGRKARAGLALIDAGRQKQGRRTGGHMQTVWQAVPRPN